MGIKYSIITVAYNSERTIEQTIMSVLSQSYSDFEYILVDGASTDKTLDIIKQYAKSDSRIRWISEPDNGIYDAMNKGLKMATGEAIALLNSDDYYEPDALENVAKIIPDTDKYVVYGMVRFLRDNIEDSIVFNSHNSLPDRMIMHPACFVSKSIYVEYKYDIAYESAADYDLFMKLYNDKTISFYPIYKVLTNFRLGGMSSSSKSVFETNEIRYRYGYISRRTKIIKNLAHLVKLLLYKWFRM